jgi:hypothetical protein
MVNEWANVTTIETAELNLEELDELSGGCPTCVAVGMGAVAAVVYGAVVRELSYSNTPSIVSLAPEIL